MAFAARRVLGRTGLRVGPLGVASSYGAPAEAFEEAFARGVNYFYWGSLRKDAMARAIANLIGQGKRDELVIVLQSYSRSAALLEAFYRKGLKKLAIDAADVLLLGWHNRPVAPRILERAQRMRDQGMFRYLGLSGHNRRVFPQLAAEGIFDLFHLRYNAVHRGAETEVFPKLPRENPPGLVTYTATRWGDLLNAGKMPPGEPPLRGADCYRFALSHPAVDICITGPRNSSEMREALYALELGPLSPAETERIHKIGAHLHRHHKRRLFG